MPKRIPTFEEAWDRKVQEEGYQYGFEALQNVRLGWEIREEIQHELNLNDALPGYIRAEDPTTGEFLYYAAALWVCRCGTQNSCGAFSEETETCVSCGHPKPTNAFVGDGEGRFWFLGDSNLNPALKPCTVCMQPTKYVYGATEQSCCKHKSACAEELAARRSGKPVEQSSRVQAPYRAELHDALLRCEGIAAGRFGHLTMNDMAAVDVVRRELTRLKDKEKEDATLLKTVGMALARAEDAELQNRELRGTIALHLDAIKNLVPTEKSHRIGDSWEEQWPLPREQEAWKDGARVGEILGKAEGSVSACDRLRKELTDNFEKRVDSVAGRSKILGVLVELGTLKAALEGMLLPAKANSALVSAMSNLEELLQIGGDIDE